MTTTSAPEARYTAYAAGRAFAVWDHDTDTLAATYPTRDEAENIARHLSGLALVS